jgi:YggT family protein
LLPGERLGYKRPTTSGTSMANLFGLLLYLVRSLLQLLSICIIASAVMSWLIAFNVMNIRHPFVRQVDRFLDAVTRPVLWPIRKVIPSIGGVDISPVIALVIIQGIIVYLL